MLKWNGYPIPVMRAIRLQKVLPDRGALCMCVVRAVRCMLEENGLHTTVIQNVRKVIARVTAFSGACRRMIVTFGIAIP